MYAENVRPLPLPFVWLGGTLVVLGLAQLLVFGASRFARVPVVMGPSTAGMLICVLLGLGLMWSVPARVCARCRFYYPTA